VLYTTFEETILKQKSFVFCQSPCRFLVFVICFGLQLFFRI